MLFSMGKMKLKCYIHMYIYYFFVNNICNCNLIARPPAQRDILLKINDASTDTAVEEFEYHRWRKRGYQCWHLCF